MKLTATLESPEGMPEPDIPFRIAILGDFSGRVSRSSLEKGPELADQCPFRIDRDNFETLLTTLGTALHLSIGGEEEEKRILIRFTDLDAFHPDRIVERMDLFQKLLQLRNRLNAPSTFSAAAAEVQAWAETQPSPHPSPPEKRNPTPDVSLLEEMLEETQARTQPASRQMGDSEDWHQFLQTIVAPYLIPRADPQQAELVAQVDAAISAQLRKILHHPDFQTLEAAWRGLFFLTQRLETNTHLHLYVVDISKAELAADLCATKDLRSTKIYRLLVEQTIQTPGSQPWAVVAGNYTFDRTAEDIEVLSRMAQIARQAGAPFLAAASPTVVGSQSFAETPDPDDWQRPANLLNREAWEALRQLLEARYVSLTLPRFLLRLPYGKETDRVEAFDFEEIPESPSHEDYLWGNPIFACLYLIGAAFTRNGWDGQPGTIQDIEGLPLHVYKEHGESQIKPCAEALLSERAAEIILDQGLMPLLSLKNQDTVRLARFQSLAFPPTPLTGRWR